MNVLLCVSSILLRQLIVRPDIMAISSTILLRVCSYYDWLAWDSSTTLFLRNRTYTHRDAEPCRNFLFLRILEYCWHSLGHDRIHSVYILRHTYCLNNHTNYKCAYVHYTYIYAGMHALFMHVLVTTKVSKVCWSTVTCTTPAGNWAIRPWGPSLDTLRLGRGQLARKGAVFPEVMSPSCYWYQVYIYIYITHCGGYGPLLRHTLNAT